VGAASYAAFRENQALQGQYALSSGLRAQLHGWITSLLSAVIILSKENSPSLT